MLVVTHEMGFAATSRRTVFAESGVVVEKPRGVLRPSQSQDPWFLQKIS